MIENNKIKSAAQGYCDATYGTLNTNPFIAEAFKDGAKWAIKEFLKDLWHEPEEEPKEKDKLLMVETGKKEHKYVHFKRNQGCMFGEWKHYAHMVDVTRWLYMDDLFPKEVDND